MVFMSDLAKVEVDVVDLTDTGMDDVLLVQLCTGGEAGLGLEMRRHLYLAIPIKSESISMPLASSEGGVRFSIGFGIILMELGSEDDEILRLSPRVWRLMHT